MKIYREVSDRLPQERTEVHMINNGSLTSGFYQDGQWYIGEHETPVITFSGTWLEPNDITESDIVKIFESRARAGSGDTNGNIYYSDLPVMYWNEVASMILSKLK